MGLFSKKKQYFTVRCSGFTRGTLDDREATVVEKVKEFKYDKKIDYLIIPCEGFVPVILYKTNLDTNYLVLDSSLPSDCFNGEGYLANTVLKHHWGKEPDEAYTFAIFYCRKGEIRLRMGTPGVQDPAGSGATFRGFGSYNIKINDASFFVDELCVLNRTVKGAEIQDKWQPTITNIINEAIAYVFADCPKYTEALCARNIQIEYKIKDLLVEYMAQKYPKDSTTPFNTVDVLSVSFSGELSKN